MINALNNPALRAEIENIEDIWSSLDRGDRRCAILEAMLDRAVAGLAAKGVNYDPR